MNISPWFDDVPVLGAQSPDETIGQLRDIGEDEVADMLQASQNTQPSSAFGLRDWFLAANKPYMHTAHAFGYLAPIQPAEKLFRRDLSETLKP
jgi:Lon protease-like protein